MPTAFKVVRDTAVNWAPPGGGVTYDAKAYAEPSGVIGISDGNGTIGFTVGQTATYGICLGRNETIGSLNGSIWTQIADNTATTLALTASTQYYLQGTDGAPRTAVIMLGYRLIVSSSSSSDTAVNVYVRGLDISGVEQRETLALVGTSQVQSSIYYSEITSLSKDVTVGAIKVADAQGYRLKLSPKQTQSLFTRIEFDTAPTDAKDIVVVYKKRVRDLLNDGDAPQLNSIDHALMTFALGDLYTKTRQLSKAAVKYEEAVSLLNVVRDRETIQQAQNIVLIPEHLGGYQASDFGWI